ncbi:MAG: hypothetical protein V3W20_09265 [Candidatus Neomarinimicrobiota bacterium]
MQFKYPHLATEFDLLDKRCQVVGYAIDGYCRDIFGIEITVTSVYREDSPTHGAYCAFDMRIEPDEGEPLFTDAQLIDLKNFTSRIKYDLNRPEKPTLYIHPNKSGKGKHGHCQVWPGSKQTVLTNERI